MSEITEMDYKILCIWKNMQTLYGLLEYATFNS